jgi:hypothetical protein
MAHRVTYVTGCSGAGKTTLYDKLVERAIPDVHELDGYKPGPGAGHADWLRWRAAEHLRDVIGLAKDGADKQHRVVTGIVWPFSLIGEEYVWRDAIEADIAVRFVLLDRPWVDIEASLLERLTEWKPDIRDEQIENNRRLQRVLRNQVLALRGGYTIGPATWPDQAVLDLILQ